MSPPGEEDLERLQLLASAMAGREVRVAPVEPGERSWTDGATIHLDPTVDHVSQVRSLAVQASLVAAGSLDPEVVRPIRRSRHLQRRYLAVEGHRALAANEAYLPRVAQRILDRDVAASVDGVDASLALARADGPLDDPPPWFGAIRPRQILAAAEQREIGASVSEPTAHTSPPDALPELDDDLAGDDPANIGQLLTSPVGGGGPVGRLLQRLFGQARDRGTGGSPGADAPTRRGRTRRGEERGVVVTGRATTEASVESVEGSTSITYPEWNVHKARYRPDWCTVIEEGPPVEREMHDVLPDGSVLRRPLSRLAMGLERSARRLQGDEIDIDAAVEARVDALAGSTPDEAVYLESLRIRRDLSVLVLLDVSGSAGEPGYWGLPVHEHQRLAVAELTTALHDLGDRVALYGFNSQGRSSVRVMRIKGFGEGIDSRFGRRLAGLVPGSYTRLGAAIRHGGSLVEEHGGTPRRLLVVVSDGFAYDHGYEGRYGEADARQALAETRRRGVGCLCLSVGARVDPAALRRVFGTAAHASVPSVGQLAPVIGPLFRSALRSAEAQRRVHRRNERSRERLLVERSGT